MAVVLLLRWLRCLDGCLLVNVRIVCVCCVVVVCGCCWTYVSQRNIVYDVCVWGSVCKLVTWLRYTHRCRYEETEETHFRVNYTYIWCLLFVVVYTGGLVWLRYTPPCVSSRSIH